MDKVGATYPAYTYEVSREKIREYAAALGETDPRWFGDGDDVVAPPTFAAAFTITKGGDLVLADPELNTHDSYVHTSQRYVYGDRPMRPGDVLTCVARIADIRAMRGTELLTVEVDCRFADGSLAVRSEGVIAFLAPEDATNDATNDATDGGEGPA